MDSGALGALASRDSDTSGGCWGQGVAPPPELGHSPHSFGTFLVLRLLLP